METKQMTYGHETLKPLNRLLKVTRRDRLTEITWSIVRRPDLGLRFPDGMSFPSPYLSTRWYFPSLLGGRRTPAHTWLVQPVRSKSCHTLTFQNIINKSKTSSCHNVNYQIIKLTIMSHQFIVLSTINIIQLCINI